MREIKFRAWDGEKMITPDKDKYYNRIRIDLSGGMERMHGSEHYDEKVDYTLMQYTGLKDKSGVEIYEGDILSPNNREVRIGEYFGPYGMGSGAYTVSHAEDYDGKSYGITSKQVSHSEVIGNIHENPELLK